MTLGLTVASAIGSQALKWLVKHWRFIIISLQAAIILSLGVLLVNSYKDNGALKFQMKVATATIKSREQDLLELAASKKEQASRESGTYAACLKQAEQSDSTAFRRGVEVGKVIGMKEAQSTCAIQP